jgi:hypothetical protein
MIFTHTSFAGDGLSVPKSLKIRRVDLLSKNDVKGIQSYCKARVDGVRVCLCDPAHFVDRRHAFIHCSGFFRHRFCTADNRGPRPNGAEQNLSIRQSLAGFWELFDQ